MPTSVPRWKVLYLGDFTTIAATSFSVADVRRFAALSKA
jgi:hypothetical protein